MKRDNYFPKMIAALIVIAIALATLVYSLVKAEPSDMEGLIIKTSDDGTILVNPSDDMPVPTSPPNITPPTVPPPNN